MKKHEMVFWLGVKRTYDLPEIYMSLGGDMVLSLSLCV
jgi:hypothetical protein